MIQRMPGSDRFADKVAIVTGGCAGIGRATLTEFCREGGSVVFTDIDLACGLETEKQLNSGKAQAVFLHGDMADDDFVAGIVDQAMSHFPGSTIW